MTTIVWLRDDLRLEDNPALAAAAEDPDGVVVIYVFEDESGYVRPLGSAAKWWLHHSLRALEQSLSHYGVSLVVRIGRAEDVIPEVVAECGADSVHWNRRYGRAREQDADLKSTLKNSGLNVRSFIGNVLFEPWTIKNQQCAPYRVYSPFWRACTSGMSPADPLPAPTTISPAKNQVNGVTIESLGLTPSTPDWSAGIAKRWSPGEIGAKDRLTRFLSDSVNRYSQRDFPAQETGSELSPHLRWGEISPRQVWYEAAHSGADVAKFLSEVGWREFAIHTAFHYGPLEKQPIDSRFDAFPWRQESSEDLSAWQRGRTGFGLVDAGMQELWQTGFMHNRVRMVTASLLTKNMQIDWRVGEAWFWDTLVDADEASNPFNWQWVAGCGTDAAPYFRIFNPELQAKKFDPANKYIDRWADYSAGLMPVLDLGASRADALESYRATVV